MSQTMTMNRVIHQAVRRDFERIHAALGDATDGDLSRAKDLDRAFRNLRAQLTNHHEGEDRWLWPMLAQLGVDHALLATMESEHHAMSEALAEAGSAMNSYASTGSAADAASAREAVGLTVTGPYLAWLTDGMTDEGRACLDSTVPRPVAAVLIRLFGRRYVRDVAPVWR